MANLPGYVTTDGGLANTRFKAPVLSGNIADGGAAGGPIPPAAGFMCIQSTAALLNQVVTTSATGLSHASFVYIPVSTAFLTGAGAPPFVGVGTPLVWNDNTATLMVWSSSRTSWMAGVAGSSQTGNVTFSTS